MNKQTAKTDLKWKRTLRMKGEMDEKKRKRRRGGVRGSELKGNLTAGMHFRCE